MNMAKFLKQRFEQGTGQRRSGRLMIMTGAGAVVLFVSFLTVADVNSFLDYLNQFGGTGSIIEMRLLGLEMTIAVIKVFLDLYLLLVSLIILAQAVHYFFGRKVRTVQYWEFAARLFLTRSVEGLKWGLIGLGLIRLMVGFFQRGLRLEPEEAPALLSLAMVLLLVGSTLYFGHYSTTTER